MVGIRRSDHQCIRIGDGRYEDAGIASRNNDHLVSYASSGEHDGHYVDVFKYQRCEKQIHRCEFRQCTLDVGNIKLEPGDSRAETTADRFYIGRVNIDSNNPLDPVPTNRSKPLPPAHPSRAIDFGECCRTANSSSSASISACLTAGSAMCPSYSAKGMSSHGFLIVFRNRLKLIEALLRFVMSNRSHASSNRVSWIRTWILKIRDQRLTHEINLMA